MVFPGELTAWCCIPADFGVEYAVAASKLQYSSIEGWVYEWVKIVGNPANWNMYIGYHWITLVNDLSRWRIMQQNGTGPWDLRIDSVDVQI